MNSLSSNGTKNQTTKPPPPPIVGVRLKKTSVEVIRGATEALGGGRKSKMICISKKSIRNAVEVLTNSDPELSSMIVCTYPEQYPDDGRIVKAHHKALLAAVSHKFGDISYFTAIEYQSRGAPHFHMALSLKLDDLGQVVTLKRKKSGRRYPAFQTVKSQQDWLFNTWLEIISKPDIAYNGEPLEWSGIDDEDLEAMQKAYHQYNAGFSWEVMRDKDGAKRYLVKELTGLKRYQKAIPDDFKNPGRHFLYSHDMIFDPKNSITFVLDDLELRTHLEKCGWKFLPSPEKLLPKFLWNVAADLAISLIEAGLSPVKGGLDALKKYCDHRIYQFVTPSTEMSNAIAEGWRVHRIVKHWEAEKRRYQRYLWATDPDPPPMQPKPLQLAF